MKKTSTFTFVIISLLIVLNSSRCKDKDDCPPCGDSYKAIPQEMKDWALFEEGSWWVYRLAEDTTIFDTVRRVGELSSIRSNASRCRMIYAPADICTEVLTYNLQHSNTDYFPHHADNTIGGFDEITLYYPPGGGVCLYYYGSGYGGGIIFAINPIIIGENYGNFTLIDTFKNLNFNYILIKEGYHSSTLADTLNTVKFVRDIHWGKNIGPVKITVYPSVQTWELINYEIKQ